MKHYRTPWSSTLKKISASASDAPPARFLFKETNIHSGNRIRVALRGSFDFRRSFGRVAAGAGGHTFWGFRTAKWLDAARNLPALHCGVGFGHRALDRGGGHRLRHFPGPPDAFPARWRAVAKTEPEFVVAVRRSALAVLSGSRFHRRNSLFDHCSQSQSSGALAVMIVWHPDGGIHVGKHRVDRPAGHSSGQQTGRNQDQSAN
jgi:hypothetical protein